MFVLRKTCDAVSRERDYLQALAIQRSDRLFELDRENDRLKAELEAAASGKEWWRDEADRLNERLVEVAAERDRVAAENDTLRADNATEHAMGRRVHQENNRLYNEVADLKAEVARLRKSSPATISVVHFPCRSSFPR